MTIRLFILFFLIQIASAQELSVKGKVLFNGQPIEGVSILLKGSNTGTITDHDGQFELNITNLKKPKLIFSYIGFKSVTRKIDFRDLDLGVIILESDETLNEVVISGTLKPVSKLDSPVPVEIYSQTFLDLKYQQYR